MKTIEYVNKYNYNNNNQWRVWSINHVMCGTSNAKVGNNIYLMVYYE